MKRLISTILFACIVASAMAAEPQLVDGVAAYVNEDIITISDVLIMSRPLELRVMRAPSGGDVGAQVRKVRLSALDALIERTLLIQSVQEEGVVIPESHVEGRISRTIDDHFDGDRARFIEALRDEGLTLGDFRAKIRKETLLSVVRERGVEGKITISPAEMHAAYEANAREFWSPTKLKLSVIVLEKTGKPIGALRLKADELRDKAMNGNDFAKLARSSSDGTKADKGGDWGWIEPSSLRRELGSAVDGLKAGDVAKIVETGYEIYVVKVMDLQEAKRLEFEQVRERLVKELKAKKAERRYDAWVKQLREEAYIKIVPHGAF